jgi:hypothetical protein
MGSQSINNIVIYTNDYILYWPMKWAGAAFQISGRDGLLTICSRNDPLEFGKRAEWLQIGVGGC